MTMIVTTFYLSMSLGSVVEVCGFNVVMQTNLFQALNAGLGGLAGKEEVYLISQIDAATSSIAFAGVITLANKANGVGYAKCLQRH